MPDDGAADLYTAYAPQIRRYLVRVLGETAADDVLADTFECVLRDLPHYQDRGHPITSWIYRIAHARAMDALRCARRHPTVPIDTAPVASDGPEAAVLAADEQAWVRSLITAHLHGPQRAVIWLRYVADLPTCEVAARLGLTEGAVKALQQRGVGRLQRAVTLEPAPVTCQAPGCDRTDLAGHGYCEMHYFRWRRRGEVADRVVVCAAPDCPRPVRTRGLCHMHAMRRWRAAQKP